MTKKNILFTDFDGVITTYKSGWHIEPEKVKHIEEILEKTNAKIVVTSSWKIGCKDVEMFINKYFQNTDSLFAKSIIDITDSMGQSRGDEIQDWLNAHKDEVEEYVILDDDCDMLTEQLFHFIQTDTYEGITEREVKMAIQLFTRERIPNATYRLNETLKRKFKELSKGVMSNTLVKLLQEYNDSTKNVYYKKEKKDEQIQQTSTENK